jgi:hypothetical protein
MNNNIDIEELKEFMFYKKTVEEDEQEEEIPMSKPKTIPDPVPDPVPDPDPLNFISKDKDKLFWCFYYMKYGDLAYNSLPNRNIVTEKKFKIDMVYHLRENKSILKSYKFLSISDIENELVNDITPISINTFLSLCAIYNINIIFIKKQKYYYKLSLCNDDNEDEWFIINETKHNNNNSYILNQTNPKNIIDKLYEIKSITKPLHSESYYKLDELKEMCNKLGLLPTSLKPKKNDYFIELYKFFNNN